MVMIGLLLFISMIIGVFSMTYISPISFGFICSFMGFVFGLIGGIIALLIKSSIDKKIIDKVEYELFTVAQGKYNVKINTYRYEDFCLKNNLIIGQSIFAVLGGCSTCFIKNNYNIIYIILFITLCILIFVYIIAVRYYNKTYVKIYDDVIRRFSAH